MTARPLEQTMSSHKMITRTNKAVTRTTANPAATATRTSTSTVSKIERNLQSRVAQGNKRPITKNSRNGKHNKPTATSNSPSSSTTTTTIANIIAQKATKYSLKKTSKKRKFKMRPGNFIDKLHLMMEYAEQHHLDSVIAWVHYGKAFVIHDPDRLVEILPLFFDLTKYRSFRRQLCMWHFKRVLAGSLKGAFYHPFFLQGQPSASLNKSRNAFKDAIADKNCRMFMKDHLPQPSAILSLGNAKAGTRTKTKTATTTSTITSSSDIDGITDENSKSEVSSKKLEPTKSRNSTRHTAKTMLVGSTRLAPWCGPDGASSSSSRKWSSVPPKFDLSSFDYQPVPLKSLASWSSMTSTLSALDDVLATKDNGMDESMPSIMPQTSAESSALPSGSLSSFSDVVSYLSTDMFELDDEASLPCDTSDLELPATDMDLSADSAEPPSRAPLSAVTGATDAAAEAAEIEGDVDEAADMALMSETMTCPILEAIFADGDLLGFEGRQFYYVEP